LILCPDFPEEFGFRLADDGFSMATLSINIKFERCTERKDCFSNE